VRKLDSNLMIQIKPLIEELLREERDRQVAQLEKQGRKPFRWGYSVRKYWRTPWGFLKRVRIPRLRDKGEIGLMEKYLPQGVADSSHAHRWQRELLEYWEVWAFFLTAGFRSSTGHARRP